jgi:hypothetical protein
MSLEKSSNNTVVFFSLQGQRICTSVNRNCLMIASYAFSLCSLMLLSTRSQLGVYCSSSTMTLFRGLQGTLENWQLASTDLDTQGAHSTASFPMYVSLHRLDSLHVKFTLPLRSSLCCRVATSRVTTELVASRYMGRSSQVCLLLSFSGKAVYDAHRRELCTSSH